MVNKIGIFLENRKLEVDDVQLALTYTFSELTNPLLITGDYSKTIKIKGTQTNNEIFGQIWNFDRIVVDDENARNVGVYFNASKRAECKIFINGGLFKSGYLKLNAINIDKGVISYDVTFYSQLCSVLHELKEKKVVDLPFLKSLRHVINKDTIVNFINGTHELDANMTYVMANNGMYEDFNSAKMHRYGSGTTVSEVEIANGLNLDECAKREYRSYQQRPALRVKKLVDLIADNNSINLDKGFFNDGNPYYANSVLTMSKLNTKEQNISYYGVLNASPYIVLNVNDYSTQWSISQNIPYQPQENSTLFPEEELIALGTLTGTTSINTEMQMKVKFIVNGSFPVGSEVLFSLSTQPTCTISTYIEDAYGNTTPMIPYSDKDSKLSFLNPGKAFIEETDGVTSAGYFWFPNPYINYMKNARIIPAMPIHFYYPAAIWVASTDYTILATITFNGAGRKCTVKRANGLAVDTSVNSVVVEMLPMNKVPENESYDANDYYPINGINYTNGFTGNDLVINNAINISSESVINKTSIIDGELTHGDFLINYTKQFGLFYETMPDGTITLKDRNIFFKDYKILDWNDKIDYSKAIKQIPLTFDKKLLELGYADNETHYAKYYKDKFDVDYGVARINTGYEFNSETEKLNDSTIFTNTVMSKERTGMLLGSNVVYMTDEKVLPAFFKLEDNQRNNADIKYSFLFDNGTKPLSNSIVISDDTYRLDGEDTEELEKMWIDTNDTTTMLRCGRRISKYRQFSTLSDDGTNSWLFGYPRENYAGWDKTTFPETSTIYNNFWKSYISEIYDVNNKTITCYIKLTPNDMCEFSFRNFIRAFGCTWHVNKINNYNPLSDEPTEVELIKVSNINAYVNGQKTMLPLLTVSTLTQYSYIEGEPEVLYGNSWEGYFRVDTGHTVRIDSIKVQMGNEIWYPNSTYITIPEVTDNVLISAVVSLQASPFENE